MSRPHRIGLALVAAATVGLQTTGRAQTTPTIDQSFSAGFGNRHARGGRGGTP